MEENLARLFEHIERNRVDDAKKLAAELRHDLKSDPELLKADLMISRVENIGKSKHTDNA